MQDKLSISKTPVLDRLYNQEQIEQIRKQNDLNIILNSEPKKEWIRQHPLAKNVRYIPIEIIEYLLTSIFLKWRVEIKWSKIVANSEEVVVRLHFLDPVSGEWDWQDGIGAAPLQTDKGAGATDFSKIKNDSVMKAAPAAKSFAIKDAAETIGKLFGKDLNRKDHMSYGSTLHKKSENLGVDNAQKI